MHGRALLYRNGKIQKKVRDEKRVKLKHCVVVKYEHFSTDENVHEIMYSTVFD